MTVQWCERLMDNHHPSYGRWLPTMAGGSLIWQVDTYYARWIPNMAGGYLIWQVVP